MKMESAKELVAKYLNVGKSRIWVDPSRLNDIKEAITGEDIKALIAEGVFKKIGFGQSKARARLLKEKKKKGRKRGMGKRKGTKNARMSFKEEWLKKVRSQRRYIKNLLLEQKIDNKTYRDLYRKIKGGFFRSKAHINIYLNKK